MGGEKAGRDSRSVMTYFRECAIVSSPSASSSQALLPSAGKKEGERNRTSRMAAQEEREEEEERQGECLYINGKWRTLDFSA